MYMQTDMGAGSHEQSEDWQQGLDDASLRYEESGAIALPGSLGIVVSMEEVLSNH